MREVFAILCMYPWPQNKVTFFQLRESTGILAQYIFRHFGTMLNAMVKLTQDIIKAPYSTLAIGEDDIFMVQG